MSNYWKNRALQDWDAYKRYNRSDKIGDTMVNQISLIYDKGYRNVENELEKVWNAYSRETGIDVQSLKTLLTKSETKKTWEQLKKQGLDKYVLDNYKARITRLEQIKAQIYGKVKLLNQPEQKVLKNGFKAVINNNYLKTIYDVQHGMQSNFTFSKLGNNQINSILKANWSGKNYRERAWFNNDKLANEVSEIIGGGLISGQSIEKTSSQIRERFGVEKYKADRLVRTETTYFHSMSDLMTYDELGIKQYVFIATLDNRTSPMCRMHDNKHYNVSEIEVGKNYPPLHPNCRSTTRAYISEEAEQNILRRGRNQQGENEVYQNISYKDWQKLNGVKEIDEISIGETIVKEATTLINSPKSDIINIDEKEIINNRIKDINNDISQIENENVGLKSQIDDLEKQNNNYVREMIHNRSLRDINKPKIDENNKILLPLQDKHKANVNKIESLKYDKLKLVYDNKELFLIKEPKTINDYKNNLSIITGIDINKINLTEIDSKTLPLIYNSYDKVISEFPQMVGKFESFGIGEKRGYASCLMRDGTIKINESMFKNLNTTMELYAKDVSSGFHCVGTDVESIIEHEIGHRIDGVLTDKVNLFKHDISQEIRHKALKDLGLIQKDIAKEVSRYATKDSEEFFAECIAEGINSKTPRRVATRVKEIVNEIFNMSSEEIITYLNIKV